MNFYGMAGITRKMMSYVKYKKDNLISDRNYKDLIIHHQESDQCRLYAHCFKLSAFLA